MSACGVKISTPMGRLKNAAPRGRCRGRRIEDRRSPYLWRRNPRSSFLFRALRHSIRFYWRTASLRFILQIGFKSRRGELSARAHNPIALWRRRTRHCLWPARHRADQWRASGRRLGFEIFGSGSAKRWRLHPISASVRDSSVISSTAGNVGGDVRSILPWGDKRVGSSSDRGYNTAPFCRNGDNVLAQRLRE